MYINDINNLLREKTGYSPKPSGQGFSARCPSHDDVNPSLSLSESADGTILLCCHAGCTVEQICTALNIEMHALFPKVTRDETATMKTDYVYQDEDGHPLYKKTRIEPGKESRKKDFYLNSRHSDGSWTKGIANHQRVLYHLPEVLNAIQKNESIFLVEGEKNAEDLIARGLVATTSIEGAGAKWKNEYTQQLKNARVCPSL